ncbi:MAG: hypothetical protein U1E03_11520 [Hyphomonadaceae bacterium]
MDVLDAVAPGRDDLVTVIQAYFDESYGPDGLLCVAGYVFTKAGVRGITGEWGNMLRRYKLPYFRMSDCAHGKGVFANIGRETRDKIAREAIRMATHYSGFGVAATISEHEFNEKVPEGPYIGNARAYEFAVWNCLMGVRQFMRDAEYKGKAAYFFEAGHRSQSAANRLMNSLFESPNMRAEYRYLSHTFVAKEAGAPIQAADLLAWQFYQDRRRELAGDKRRKDMEALMSKQAYVFRHINIERHAQMVQKLMDEISSEIAAGQDPS